MENEQTDWMDMASQDELKGMVRNNDYQTSIDAAKGVKKKISKLHGAIMAAFKREGPMTDGELEDLEEFKHYGQTTVSKRRTELKQRGLLVEDGKRATRGRNDMTIWKLTGLKYDGEKDPFDDFIHTDEGGQLARQFIARAVVRDREGDFRVDPRSIVKECGREFTDMGWYRRIAEFAESKKPYLKNFFEVPDYSRAASKTAEENQ